MLPEDLVVIHINVRSCWVLAEDLRVSRADRPFDEPCFRTIVLETVKVEESHRRYPQANSPVREAPPGIPATQ